MLFIDTLGGRLVDSSNENYSSFAIYMLMQYIYAGKNVY